MNRNKNFSPSQSTYKQQSRLSLLRTAEGRIHIFRVSGVRYHKSQQRILEDIFLSSKFKMWMPKIRIFFSYLDQSCSASALLTCWDCPVYWWLFSSITGPHPPDGGDSLFPNCDTKNVSRRGQISPGRQNAPLLGTTLRSLIPMPCGCNWEFLHHSAPKASDLECRTFREDLGWATKPSLGFRDPGLKRTMEELSPDPSLFFPLF